MRIGVCCGSFNPVHLAHLLLAESCREQLSLDRMIFVPAGRPPNKRKRPLIAAENRWTMLRLAVAGYPEYEVSRYEIDRAEQNDGLSWTVDTIRNLRREYAQRYPGETHEWFLPGGADMFMDIPRWYQASELIELVTPIGVRRPGCEAPDAMTLFTPLVGRKRAGQIAEAQIVVMPQMEISGTELRRRIATGKSIRWKVPTVVEEWIREYRPVIPDEPPGSSGSPGSS
ncbi:MAG: nicotinate-nucleotide adenylyltransferase, partial [Planctomycetia bacterium]|nr:nicotinate-nucleotide adenylyltransferase [Planctomycetia bacterium]